MKKTYWGTLKVLFVEMQYLTGLFVIVILPAQLVDIQDMISLHYQKLMIAQDRPGISCSRCVNMAVIVGL